MGRGSLYRRAAFDVDVASLGVTRPDRARRHACLRRRRGVRSAKPPARGGSLRPAMPRWSARRGAEAASPSAATSATFRWTRRHVPRRWRAASRPDRGPLHPRDLPRGDDLRARAGRTAPDSSLARRSPDGTPTTGRRFQVPHRPRRDGVGARVRTPRLHRQARRARPQRQPDRARTGCRPAGGEAGLPDAAATRSPGTATRDTSRPRPSAPQEHHRRWSPCDPARLPQRYAVTPPWRKAVYSDPESAGHLSLGQRHQQPHARSRCRPWRVGACRCRPPFRRCRGAPTGRRRRSAGGTPRR